MLNDFIRQTKELLLSSDIKIHNLKLNKIKPLDDGTIQILSEFGPVNFTSPEISDNTLLHTTIVFTLADVLIDIRYPKLEGKNFSQRYRQYELKNDEDVVFIECYRIMKLIRNAVTHSRSNFELKDDILYVDYKHRGTRFSLEISKYGLELIYTFMLNEHVPEHFPGKYKEGVMRSLYLDIYKEVSLSDENGSYLKSIRKDQPKLARTRDLIINTKFESLDNSIKIMSDINSIDDTESGAIDFLINLDDEYIVPIEELNQDLTITNTYLSNWRINTTC